MALESSIADNLHVEHDYPAMSTGHKLVTQKYCGILSKLSLHDIVTCRKTVRIENSASRHSHFWLKGKNILL